MSVIKNIFWMISAFFIFDQANPIASLGLQVKILNTPLKFEKKYKATFHKLTVLMYPLACFMTCLSINGLVCKSTLYPVKHV